MPSSGSLEAKTCSKTSAKAYFGLKNNGTGSITFCSDKIHTIDFLKRLLQHELIHAHDHFVVGLDLYNIEDLACSEISAATQGECSTKIISYFDWYKKNCVKKHALSSTKLSFPSYSTSEVKEIIDKKFKFCFERE